ncbi:MAG: Alpha-ketoglutarate-dependent taurine dioxygenase, partial [uncultured Ramlibacter sp.]
ERQDCRRAPARHPDRARCRHRIRQACADLAHRADGGRPGHADGRAAAALLAPDRTGRRRDRHAAQGSRAGRGPDPVPRQGRPARPGVSALRAPGQFAVLRQGRGARHPLLLPRLAVRRAGPVRGAALRTGRRQGPRPHPPAVVPGAGAVRTGVDLHGPTGEEAGAAPLRMPGAPGSGRIPGSQRQQHRRRRAAGHSVQLAAALREPGRPVPRRHPAFVVQRHAVRRADGADAAGDLGVAAAERTHGVGPKDAGRQDLPPHQRGRAADAAGDPQSARRQIRTGGVDRLGAADRRPPLPHLRGRPGAAGRRAGEDALTPGRQAVGRAERGRAPAVPGRLRGHGEPGPRRQALRGTPGNHRSGHRDAAAFPAAAAGRGAAGWRPGRRQLRPGGAARALHGRQLPRRL